MPKYSDRINNFFTFSHGLSRTLHLYHTHPVHCKTADEVTKADARAARDIEELQNMIDLLTEYRQALAYRYNDLATMPYKEKVSLKRSRSYHGNITYTLKLSRIYEDTTEEDLQSQTYPGTERHKAIAAYKDLQKHHPDAETELNIEKRSWER